MKHSKLQFVRYKRSITVAFLFLFSFSVEQAFSGGPIIAAGGSYAADMRSSLTFPGSASESQKEFKGILKYFAVIDDKPVKLHCTAPQNLFFMMQHALSPEGTMMQLEELMQETGELQGATIVLPDQLFWSLLAIQHQGSAKEQVTGIVDNGVKTINAGINIQQFPQT